MTFATPPGALEYAGGGEAHALPVVVVTSPTPGQVYSTGGPTITFAYTYTQQQGDVLAAARLVLFDINDNIIFDTNYNPPVDGTQANQTLTIDLVASGIPTDTNGSGLIVRVFTQSSLGAAFEGVSDPVGFDVQWGVVTVTLDVPAVGQQIPLDQLVEQWTFASTRGKTQGAYRARLLTGTGNAVLADSMKQPGAAFQWPFDFQIAGGSNYIATIQVWNAEGVASVEVKHAFVTPAGNPATFPKLDSVGRVFEIAINGKGYMLYDGHDDEPDYTRSRQVAPLYPNRLSTTNTPFSDNIERYSFRGFFDWRGGAGQQRTARPDSSDSSFIDSDGIDPFDPYQLTLLHDTSLQISSTYATARSVVASDALYALTGDSQLTWIANPDQVTPTVLNVTDGVGAITATSLASDGQFWYLGGAGGILRGTTTDPAAKWSTIAGTLVRWAGGRICAAVAVSPSITANRFTTLAPDGTEEVASGRITLDKGWTISDVTSGGAFVWFAAYSPSGGYIYKWNLTTDTPSVALPLMTPHKPRAVFWYQGSVYVRTEVTHGTTTKANIFRCEPDANGDLTPFLIAELDVNTSTAQGTFGADQRLVFFSWPNSDLAGKAGLGAIDVTTGGYAKWLKGDVSAGHVRNIMSWRGRTFFSIDALGVYAENATTYVTDGNLRNSIDDLGSAQDKVWDSLSCRTRPLPPGTSIDIDYSIDSGDSYTPMVGAQMNGGGQTGVDTTLGVRSHGFGVRINMHSDGSATPEFLDAEMQCHPIGKADVVLVVPIDCRDKVTDLRGQPLPDNGVGSGSARAAELEALAQTRVLVQDIDWVSTQTAEVFEIVQIERKSRQVYRHGVNETGEVAMVTMRRPLR